VSSRSEELDAQPVAAGVPSIERLRAIVRAHFSFVWRTALRLGLPEDAADDAAQQVFIVLARRIDDVTEGSEKAFLYRTTAHVVAEARRTHARRAQRMKPADDVEIDAAKHPALLMVDTISGLASADYRHDEWGVDVTVSGSQKGLMLPAGMGILGVSQKAIGCMEGAKSRRCYFDLGDMLKANATGYFPYTPSLPMLYGLRESLDIIEEEGLENIFFRHAYLAEGVRAAITQGWGLKLCAKEPKWYSNTVSAIVVPEGFNAAHVIDVAFRRYNLALGAGLSKVAGKVFRIGHLGDLNELMLMGAIAGAEMSMLDIGIQVTPGSGVAAASNYWRTHDPIPKKRVSREEVIYASQQMGSVN